MTASDRHEYHAALRLKGDYPEQALRMLCTLHRSARTAKDRQTYADAILANGAQFKYAYSFINGCFICD
jgi:hypothetical protein